MTIFEAIIQGIIQGATEFLPVSSSGHLSISKHLFGIELPGILFDVMLHLGTLIAVVFVYRELIWRLIKEFGSLVRGHRPPQLQVERDEPGPAGCSSCWSSGLLPLFLLFLPIPGTGMGYQRAVGYVGVRFGHRGGRACPAGHQRPAFCRASHANKRVKEIAPPQGSPRGA